jgi:phage-related minor tail protein
MADNKLNLLFKFTGIDKVSGSIRNIVGASKAGAASLREMQKEVKANEKELVRVRELLASGSLQGGLVMAERELAAAIEETNHRIEQQRNRLERVNAVQAKASKIAHAAAIGGAAASATLTAPLIAFGKEAVEAASDAYELQSAFDVTFGKNAAVMTLWAEQTGAAMGRSKMEIEQAANTFGVFFNAADPAKSAAMSKQFAVLAQDLSSFYNVEPGEALEKLRSGLTGEAEPLRDFGIFLSDAAVKAQALKMGMKPVGKEFTEQQKIMARAGLIMASTTNAQGDVLRTSNSMANQLRASNAAWQDMSVAIGTELLPAVTPAIRSFGDLIRMFTALSPSTRKWIVLLGVGAAAIGPMLLGVASIVSIVGTLAPLFIGTGAAASVGAAGVGAAGVAAGGAATGFGALALAALPVIAAVAAVAGAAYLIYSNWGAISGFFTGLWATVTGAFTRNWTTIRNVLLGGIVIFMPLVAGVIYVASLIYRNWDRISAATMSMVSRVAGIVGPFIRPFVAIQSYLSGLVGRFFGFGANIVGGLVNGIVSMSGKVLQAIVNLAGSVGAKFASMLGIHSPSRLFMEMGGHINDGLGIGIRKGQDGPVRAVGRMAASVAGAGAMALAPAASARAPAAGGSGDEYHFHITQQPGEDSEAFAQRVADLVAKANDAKKRRGFGDDF